MKSIDDFIKKHRDDFDDLEPEKGHLERFNLKLDNISVKTKTLRWNDYLKIAAALIIISGTIILFVLPRIENSILSDKPENIEFPAQLVETEAFYKQNIESKLKEFEKLNCKLFEMEKYSILQDLSEIDAACFQLKEELQQNRNDQRLIDAIINTYQVKYQILDTIIEQLKINC